LQFFLLIFAGFALFIGFAHGATVFGHSFSPPVW
jgi:hypothetical protein